MSREKQIEEMAKVIDEYTESLSVRDINKADFAERFAEALYNADFRKQSEWISIAERLPDCEYGAETEALLFRLKTGTVEAGYFGTGGRFRDKYFRCYHHANEGWDAKDVTHWMPLPEPPKPER